jgi:ADP-heptose:LPS heptosyltransferase
MNFARLLVTRPLTFCLFIVFRILALLRPLPTAAAKLSGSPESIVIFSTAGIGDTLSDTPAIRAVKETYPSARITVVVHEARRTVLQNNPFIDKFIHHRKSRFFSTWLALRRLKPDVAIVLRANDPDIWPLAYLSGAECIVSRPQNTLFKFLINAPADVPGWLDLPGVLQTIEIVKRIGVQARDTRMVFHLSEAERRNAQNYAAQHIAGADKDGRRAPRIAVQIHYSPRLAFRDWPESSFVSLCKKILTEYQTTIFLTGGLADRQKADCVMMGLRTHEGSRRVINTAGQLSIRQTAALIEQCAMFVTSDTGVMHIAFALNVPTLAMLHPYNARRVSPHGYGGRHRTVIMPGTGCEDNGELCPLSGLSADTVWNAFRGHYATVGA